MRTISKLFIYGISLGGIEQLMVLTPNSLLMRSEIVINNHFNYEVGIKAVSTTNLTLRGAMRTVLAIAFACDI